jgi:hypothetical protein
MRGHVSVCVFVCVMMMCKYAYETWNGCCSLYLLLVVVASAAFVQRWRYMLMSLCLLGLILFPLVLVTALSVSDL